MTVSDGRSGESPRHFGAMRAAQLFSTPFEIGLRAAFLLHAVSPAKCDLRRLTIYDYLLVHSADVDDGPESLHPATPHRSGELLIKRELMREGLTLFLSRELVQVQLGSEGVTYSTSALTGDFLDYIRSAYGSRLRETAAWVAHRFADVDDQTLEAYVGERLGRWGGEFTQESLVREVPA
jgi:hypothetical protein